MARIDFFSINLPYVIRGNNTKGWIALNREYQPISTKYKSKSLTEKKMKELSVDGELLKEDEDYVIFLYNDKTNPVKSNINWNTYFEKIRTLSKLKLKPD